MVDLEALTTGEGLDRLRRRCGDARALCERLNEQARAVIATSRDLRAIAHVFLGEPDDRRAWPAAIQSARLDRHA